MSSTSISIDDGDAIRVSESSIRNTGPVDDSSKIGIRIGDETFLWTTVGRWREVVAAVDSGIAGIPAERERFAAMSPDLGVAKDAAVAS